MRKLDCARVVGVFALLASTSAWAAGIAVDVQSGRATGMASAVTANAPDPDAVLFNPAEIVRDECPPGLAVQVGDTLLIPTQHFTPADGSPEIDGLTPVIPPFTGYVTYGINRKLALGLGVFNLFGLKIRWPENWVGRELIREATLTTYYVNPEVAYRLGPVKVGAGFQLVRGTVSLERAINFVDNVGQVELAAGAWGAGGNAGLLVNVIQDHLDFAATYRSRVKLDFDGHAHFSDVPPEFAGTAPGQIRDQRAKTTLWLPDIVTLGLSGQPVKNLRVNFDASYYSWQLFQVLRINFEDPTLDSTEPKHWHHTWNFHLGGEYALHKNFDVRAGAMWDPTPNPENTLGPDIPDSNRLNLAVGVGAHVHGFSLDVGYQYIIFFDHTSTLPQLPGTYGGHVHAVSISAGLRL